MSTKSNTKIATGNNKSVAGKLTTSAGDNASSKNTKGDYHLLFEQNLAGIYQTTVEGRIINCNDAFAKMLKYDSAEELIGLDALELYFTPNDRNRFLSQLRQHGKLSNYEIVLRCKDGSAVHILESISLREDPASGEQFCDGIVLDITERTVAQQQMAWLIGNTEESFILLNRELEIISFNKQFGKLYKEYLGVTVRTGDSILNYALPGRRASLETIYHRVLKGTEEMVQITLPLHDSTVRHFMVKYKPARNEDEAIIGIFVSIVDETEKRNAQILQQKQSMEKEALINTTSDLIWSLTCDYRLIAANNAFLNRIEASTGKRLQPGDDLMEDGSFDNDFLMIWKRLYERAFNGESFIEEIYTASVDDQPESWAETRFNPIYNGDHIIGAACYTRDTTAAKASKSRLLKMFKRLETAQQIAHLGYWEFDLVSNALYWTDEVYRIWGISPDQDINYDFFYNSIHPSDREIFELTQTRALNGIGRFSIEHRIILADGSVRFVNEIGDVIYDSQGKPIRLEGSVQDITDRKKSEADIKELANRLLLATNSAGLGIWEWNVGDDRLVWDDRMYRIFDTRKRAGKLLYADWLSLVHPEDREGLNNEIDKALIFASEFVSEYRITWPDNSTHYICTTGTVEPIKEGAGFRVIGTSCDITAYRMAEKRNQFKAELLNTIGQAVVSTNLDGNINFWNSAAESFYGWTTEEVMGRNVLDIMPAENSREQADAIMAALHNGQSWSGEFLVRHKNGNMFPVFVTDAPFYDEKNRLSGFIGVSTDITERKRVDATLKELNTNLNAQAKDLAASNAELEQFAYVASHDLQEPLRMVTSFLQKIEKKYGHVLDEKGRSYISFAVDGAKRMREIILDLLDFSRIGRTDDGLETVDLNAMIDDLRLVFRKYLVEKDSFIHSDQLPVVISAPTPLRQVFQNIISNGLKYRRKLVPPQIRISATPIEGYWQFSLSDNGIGIHKDYFEKIFVIFQRLHSRNEFSGTGMGLAITKKTVENLGGRIWLESSEGEGSTFHFTIPRND